MRYLWLLKNLHFNLRQNKLEIKNNTLVFGLPQIHTPKNIQLNPRVVSLHWYSCYENGNPNKCWAGNTTALGTFFSGLVLSKQPSNMINFNLLHQPKFIDAEQSFQFPIYLTYNLSKIGYFNFSPGFARTKNKRPEKGLFGLTIGIELCWDEMWFDIFRILILSKMIITVQN